MAVPSWTDERIDRLKELWKAGATASEIALDLGNVTRNAVCGKIDRLGLGRGGTKPTRSERETVQRGDARARVKSIRPRKTAVSVTAIVDSRNRIHPGQLIIRCVDIEPRHIGLLELTDATCKWPYGEGPFTFCGFEVVAGRPYCLAHTRLSIGIGTASERAATNVLKREAA